MQTQSGETIGMQVQGVVTEGLAVLGSDTDTTRGQALPLPHFVTGLATAPLALPRSVFGLGASLVVPPSCWAVTHLPGGGQQVYGPGSYWLWQQPGVILVQWVDGRRQQLPVGPIEGWSADKWRVRLWLLVEVEVVDPTRIADYREPLGSLGAATRAAALRYIEQHPHAALTGCVGSVGGIDAPAETILARLSIDPALDGLAVVAVRVVERQGDERQIEAATTATVAAAQIDEQQRVAAARHRARLHDLEAQAGIAEREHTLRLAATAATARELLLAQQAAVQQAALAARLDVVLAQINAQVAEIAHDEQAWQRDQERLQGEWERAQLALHSAHSTDQQLRLLDAQQGLIRTAGDVVLAAQERHDAQTLALAAAQQRIDAQRAFQKQAIAERRAAHEQALLDLHLRHEQLVAEQMQKLEGWRTEQQQQHDRQLAGIVGTAQIAAAAAQHSDGSSSDEQRELATAGLLLLQHLAE